MVQRNAKSEGNEAGKERKAKTGLDRFPTIRDARGRILYVLVPVAAFGKIRKALGGKGTQSLREFLEALPEDDMPTTASERAAVRKAREEMKRGEGVTHAEARRILGL